MSRTRRDRRTTSRRNSNEHKSKSTNQEFHIILSFRRSRELRSPFYRTKNTSIEEREMASAEVVVALPAPSLSVSDPAKKKPIQIAHAKKPLFFYVNLAKRRFQEDHEVELSALGNAISTAVKVSEILKNTGFALLKDIDISSVPVENKILGRMMFKTRIVLVLKKTEKADSPVAEFGTTDKDDSPKGPLTSDGSEDSADGEHKEATDGDNKNPSEVAVKEEVFVKEEEKEIKYEQSY